VSEAKTYYYYHSLTFLLDFSLSIHFKLLIVFISSDMSKVQDDEVGDGTTSVAVLAAELLRVNKTKRVRVFVYFLLTGHVTHRLL